ncbi:MAG: hypothetical protein C5S48_07925 [Candidatus Methanogaster sp.]|nr:MAG: hypothetical protein C5S48_07925 [ANME-2 cluster archaeon]
MTFGELKWDVLSSSRTTCRTANNNNAIEEWTFEKGGTCRTCVTHFGLQFTLHRKVEIGEFDRLPEDNKNCSV